jgi:hypothetical protein
MSFRPAACALVFHLVTTTPALAAGQPFAFALMGDAPYAAEEEQPVAEMIDVINRQPVEFVVHIGDIKNGHSPCSDELFRDRLELFSRSRHPFIYTPGDNEWTDCHRWSDGGYDPVERLRRLREIFYPDDYSLGQSKLKLKRQSDDANFADYRENTRWLMHNVIFVTVNVPGSNNNYNRSAASDAEYRDRNDANKRWLRKAYAEARRPGVLGLAIFFQADPKFERMTRYSSSSGYRDMMALVCAETRALKKPVMLGHGDTHRYRVDRPLRNMQSGKPIDNFLRVETYGSPTIGWVRITVDPAGAQLFRVEPGR